jgi:hypothetical protein
MHQPQVVCLVQATHYLPDDVDHLLRGLRPVSGDQLLEVHPVEQLHRVVEGAVGGVAVVVNRHDVRMIEAGED